MFILQTFRRFTYVTAHSPTLPLLHLRHSSFSNPCFASPTSQALHLIHLASRPWSSSSSGAVIPPSSRLVDHSRPSPTGQEYSCWPLLLRLPDCNESSRSSQSSFRAGDIIEVRVGSTTNTYSCFRNIKTLTHSTSSMVVYCSLLYFTKDRECELLNISGN